MLMDMYTKIHCYIAAPMFTLALHGFLKYVIKIGITTNGLAIVIY